MATTEAIKVADIPATRQWPDVGRTLLVFSDRWPAKGLPGKVCEVKADPGPHPLVDLVAFGVGSQTCPIHGAIPVRDVFVFDPLDGRRPEGVAVWAEWMPYQARQHAARAIEPVTGRDDRD